MRDRSVHFTDEELATLGSFDEEPNVSLPESTDTPMAEDNAFEGSSVHDLLFPDLNSRVPKPSFSYEDAAEEVRNPRPMTTALERLESSLGGDTQRRPPMGAADAFAALSSNSDTNLKPWDEPWEVDPVKIGGVSVPHLGATLVNLPGGMLRGVTDFLSAVSPYHLGKGLGIRAGEAAVAHTAAGDDDRLYRHFMDLQAKHRKDEGFTEIQQVLGGLGRDIGTFAKGTFANPYDPADAALFDPSTTEKRMPMLHAVGEQIESVLPGTPWDQEYNPEWSENLSRLIQEESGELALELVGARFGSISRAVRSTSRGIRRGIDDITFADTFDLDGVDVLGGRGALSAQERLAQATVQLRAYEGSRLRKVGTAVRTEEGLLTASHTLIGTPRRVGGELTGDLDIGQVHTRTLGDDPEFGAVRGILEIDPEQDIALLEEIGTGGPTVSLAEAVEAGTQQLGYGASGRLAEVHTPRGHVIGEEVESERGGVLGFTSARSVGGVSGAGLVSPEGDLTGIYLGTLERGGTEVGMFTPARGIERMLSERDVSAESLPVSQLDSRANLERLYGEGLAQRVRRRDPGLTIRDTGPFATGLFTEDAALPGDTSLDLQSGDPSFQDEGFDIEESADLSEFERRLERRYSGPEGKVPFEYDPDQTFSELIRAVSQEEGVFFRIGRRDEDLSKLVTPEDWRSYYRPAQATEFGAVGELESLGRSPGDEIHYLQRETGQRKDVFYEGVVAQSDYSGIFERLQELEYKERTGQVEPGESTLQILTGRVSREWSPTLLKKERLGDPETRVSDYLLTDAQVLFEFEGLPASTQYGEQRVESFRVGRETPYEAPELTGLVEPRERWVEPEEVDDVSEPRVFADMEPLVRWYREREAEKIKLDRPGMYAAGIRTREALPPPTDIERVQMPAEPPFMPSNIKKLRAIEARQMKETDAAKPSYEAGFALDVNDPSYYQRMEDDVEGSSATIGSRNLEMGDVDLFEDHQDVDDPYFFDYEEGRKADEPYLKDYTEGFKEQDYKPEVWQSKDLDPEKGIWEEKEVGTDWIEEYGETDSELGTGLDRDTGMLDPMLDEPEGADSYGIYGFSSEVKEVIDDIGDDFTDRVELRIAIESKDPDLRARIIQEETQRDPDWREREFIEQIETDFEKAGVPLPEFDLDVAFADVISKLEDPDGWRDRYQAVKERGDANELSRFIAPVVREVTTAHADWYESLIPRLDLLLEEGDQKTSIYRDSLGWQNKALSSDIVDLEISEVDTQREIQRALEEKDKIVEDLRFARGTENEIGFRQELEEQEKRLFSLRSSERDITRRKERLASTLEKSLETRDADADAVDPIDPIDPEERRFALEDITDIRSALTEALDPGQLQGDLLQFRQDIIQEEVLADRIQRREKRDPSRRATLPVRSDILRGFAEKRLDSPEFGALLSDRRISDISSQVQTDFTWTERVTGVLSRGRVESLGGELDIFGLRSFDLSRDRVRDFGETVFLAERSQTRTLGAVDSESMGFRRGVEFTGIELDPPQELAESYISEARSYVTDEELAAAWHISEYQETALRSRVMGDTFTRWVEEQRSPEVRVLAGRSAEELFSEYDDPSGRRTPERNAALQRLSQVRGEVSAEGLTDLGETVFQAEVSQARALEIERGRSLGVEPSETLRTAEEFRQRSREREVSEYARMSYELEKESRITARAGSPRISAESRIRPREFEQEQRLRDIERLTKSREDIDTRIAEGVDDPDALRQRDAIDKQIEILESDSSIKYHSGDIDVPRPLDLSQSQARRRNVWDLGSERTYGIELELITNLTRDEMLGELDPQVQRGLELTYDTSIRTVRDDVALESVAKTSVGEEIVFREEARQYKRYIDEWGDRDETQLASPSDFDTQFAHELVFPVMQGAEGLDFIGQTFERLQDLEVELNTSMGLHVHVGGDDLSNYDLTGVLTAFSGREGVIDLMSEPSRRGRGALYAESLVEGEPELLPRHRQNLEWAQEMARMGGRSLGTPKERLGFLSDIGYGDRYQKLNLGGFGGRTIEYRQPGPSLELSEVSSHIGFITNFVDRYAGASFQEAADIPRSLPERLSELDLVFEEPSRPGQLITGIEYHSGLEDPDAYRYAAAMGLDLPDPPSAMAAQSWYSREEPAKQVVKAPGQQAVDESMVDFLQGPDDLGDIADQDVFEEVPTDFFDPAPVPEELPPDFFDTSPVPEDLGMDYFDPDPVFEEMSPDLFEELPDSRAVVPGSEPQLAITGQKYLPTPSQQRALEHTHGPAVVLAGPGSGKSQTLIGRLKELTQQNVAVPDDILTLVFGKKAQEELTERTRSIGGDWNIKTIDAFAYSVVRENFEELGYERSPDITSENFESWLARSEDFLTTMDISLDFEERRSWGEKYERARRDVVSGREDYSDLPENVQRAIYAFRAEKFKSSQVDFSDVISQAGYLLETNPELRKRYQEKFPFVQIDEFQDVSLTQHRLLSNLSENLWAVGDLDQSIMSFRGGSGEVMRDMIYEGASLYNIEENFRSIPEIVEGAQGFIRESPGRFDLQQEAVRPSGDPISLVPIAKSLSERDVIARVAEQIQPDRQTAILTRTRRERDTYQSQVSARLEAMGWEQEQIEGSLTFETLHGSKGLQWEDVILPINLLDSPYGKGRSRDITLPSRHAKTPELMAEEERLFYVAITRAEDRLSILASEQHAYFERVARVTGQKKEDKVADFLGQIPSPGQAVTGALDALDRQAEKRPAPARKEVVASEEAPTPEPESETSGLFGRALRWGKEAVKESIEGALDQYLTGDSLKREGRQALGEEDRVGRELREKREKADDDDTKIDLQAGDVPEGTRYASEHMMRPEHFQSAMDRGFLSGQVGRSRGLLYFSEGAHYREKARGESYSHGFIFDPEVLEDEFGAVVPENRLDAIMRASGRDLGESDLAELLEYQRQYDVNVEPDFTVKEDVPLEYAIGITDETGAYWIDPETRSDDPNRWDLWSVEDEELGGLEPGSFAGRGVGSLIIPEDLKIDLHSGRPDLSTPEGMASYWSQVQKRGRKFREHTGEYDRSHLEDLGRTKLLPEDFEEAEQTHIDFGDFKIDLHGGLEDIKSDDYPDWLQSDLFVSSSESLVGDNLDDLSEISRARGASGRGLSAIDEDVFLPYQSSRNRKSFTESFRDWKSDVIENRAWGGFTQQATDVLQNAAVIQTAATLTVEGVRGLAGHDVNIGSFIRAGVQSGVAIGGNLYNRRYGSKGVLPEKHASLDIREETVAAAGTPDHADFYLKEIFEKAGAGRAGWSKSSLQKTLSTYDYEDLIGMFGEEGADLLGLHAHQTAKFGQKSFQTQRDFPQTLLGIYSGDIPRAKRYTYSADTRDVTVEQSKRWTLDRLIDKGSERSSLLSSWKLRREQLRESPEEDFLGKFIGPLQDEDVTPHIGYMMVPEARGIGRFFGRYFAEPQGLTFEDILRKLPGKEGSWTQRWADDISKQKEFLGRRADILEGRKLSPEFYEWQDPQHFFERMGERLGVDTSGVQVGREMLGSPYSRFGRFLSDIPSKYKRHTQAAGGVAGGFAAKKLYDFFTEEDDETLVLSDPARYSLSPRYPLLGAVQRTLPYRRLRARAEQALDSVFGEDSFHSEMMKSILLGRKDNLPGDVKEIFVKTGQVHALVQSGMHVSLFSSILGRYPGLAVPAGLSALKDTIRPPENEYVSEASNAWSDAYKPSPNPWSPRWNPQKFNAPKDFELPGWAWWDPESDAAYEHKMARDGARDPIEGGGYIYRLTHSESEKKYVGLSVNDPLGKTGRVRQHLTGKGSKNVKAELDAGAVPSDFVVETWHVPDTSPLELGRLERYMIRASNAMEGYNKTSGGETRVKRKERELITSEMGAKDIFPASVYSAFGVLPEAAAAYALVRSQSDVVSDEGLFGFGNNEILDINTATASDFENLPGIGPSRAAEIIKSRDVLGGFSTYEEFDDVKGIGEKTFKKLRPLIKINEGGNYPESELIKRSLELPLRDEVNDDGSYRKSGFEFDQHGGTFKGFNPWLDATPEGTLESKDDDDEKGIGLKGLESGYIYRLQSLHEDKSYTGISDKHPLVSGGRIRKDLKDYDPSDFSIEIWGVNDLKEGGLKSLKRKMIQGSMRSSEGGYTLSGGGDVVDDSWDVDPDFFRSLESSLDVSYEAFDRASVPLSYPKEIFEEDYFTLDEKDQLKKLYDARMGEPISERRSVIRSDAPDVDYQVDIPEDVKIDITDARAEVLQEVPGLHSRLAEDIVRYREEVAPIQTLEQLGEFKGMSDERLAEVSRYVKIPGSTGDEQAFDDPKEIESEVWEESLLDINLASAEELADLPGLGDVTAQRIVESREREGVFPSLDALTRVKGVGKTAVEKLEGLATPAGIMDHPGTGLVGTGLEERGILELDVSGRAEDDRIDLNLATAEELQEIKGIGPSIAERIVGYRDAKSGLADISELQEVRGISERMVEGLLEDDSVKLSPVYPFGQVFGTDAPFSEYPAAEDITGIGPKPYLQAPLYSSQDVDEVPVESGFEYALKKYQEEHGKTVFPGDRAARRGGRGGMAPEEEMSYLDVFSYVGMGTLASIPSDLFRGFAQKSDVNAEVAERLKKLEAEQEELKESIEKDISLTVSQREERLEGLETRYAKQQERIEGYTVTGSDVISDVAERAGNRALSFAGDQLLNKAAASPFGSAVKGAVSKGISALKPLIPAAAPVALVAGAALVGEASLNAGYEDVVPSAQDRKNAFESQFVLQTDGGVTSWQQGWAEGYRAARSETGRGGDAGAPARLEDFITDNFVKVIDRKLRVLTAKGITRQN